MIIGVLYGIYDLLVQCDVAHRCICPCLGIHEVYGPTEGEVKLLLETFSGNVTFSFHHPSQ